MTRDEAEAIAQGKMWELVPNARALGFSDPMVTARSLVDALEALGVLKLDVAHPSQDEPGSSSQSAILREDGKS